MSAGPWALDVGSLKTCRMSNPLVKNHHITQSKKLRNTHGCLRKSIHWTQARSSLCLGDLVGWDEGDVQGTSHLLSPNYQVSTTPVPTDGNRTLRCPSQLTSPSTCDRRPRDSQTPAITSQRRDHFADVNQYPAWVLIEYCVSTERVLREY